MNPYILYDMRCAHFLLLQNIEDVFDPQVHLREFEKEEHGDFTAVNSAKYTVDVVFERDMVVDK